MLAALELEVLQHHHRFASVLGFDLQEDWRIDSLVSEQSPLLVVVAVVVLHFDQSHRQKQTLSSLPLRRVLAVWVWEVLRHHQQRY